MIECAPDSSLGTLLGQGGSLACAAWHRESRMFRTPVVASFLVAALGAVSARGQYVVNVGYDAPDADLTDGVADADLLTPGLQTTLRAAIQEANIQPVGPTYTIQFGHNGLLLSVIGGGEGLAATGDLDLRNNIAIRGNGMGVTTIDASVLGDRAFHVVVPGIRVDIMDLEVFGGVSVSFGPASPAGGGAIRHDAGTLVCNRVSFRNNATTGGASSHGGAIHAGDRLETVDCYFEGNTATGHGGAVHSAAYHGSTNDQFWVNHATRRGGGVHSDGFYDAIGAIFNRNRTDLIGGGVYISSLATGSLLYCRFERNDSLGSGGGLGAGGACNVFQARFTVNHAVGSGGGMLASADCTITQSTFDGNLADSFGGALATAVSTSTIAREIDCFLNIAAVSGGAISNGGTLTLTHSTIRDNFAQGSIGSDAGGGGISNLGTLSVTNCTIAQNHAPLGVGGGILNNGLNSIVESTSNTIAFNDAVSGNSVHNGGIFGPSFFILTHTVLASPFPAPNVSGLSPLASFDHNFDSDGTGMLAGPNDINGVPGSFLDPYLASLAPIPGSYGPMMRPHAISPLRQAGVVGPLTSPSGMVVIDDQAFRLRPPIRPDIGAAQELCRADYNFDGSVDILDFLDFFNDFGNLDPRADVNLDGSVDVLDFLEWFNWFGSGCP